MQYKKKTLESERGYMFHVPSNLFLIGNAFFFFFLGQSWIRIDSETKDILNE